MNTQFKHEITRRNWKTNEEDIIQWKWFRNSFIKSAFQWFNWIVLLNYAGAKKIKDTSIAGYHWEHGDFIFELR